MLLEYILFVVEICSRCAKAGTELSKLSYYELFNIIWLPVSPSLSSYFDINDILVAISAQQPPLMILPSLHPTPAIGCVHVFCFWVSIGKFLE
jgi:hypothetical protein